MNAAFLLVTTAWIAGADAAAPPAKPTPQPAAPVYSVGTGGCTGGGCGGCDSCGDCGCDSGHGGGLFSKLKARLHRSDDCGCDSGCGGHGGGLLSRFKGFGHKNDCDTGCGCGSSCDSCDSGHGGGLRGKLRGLFHRSKDCGCDTGCGGCDTGCNGCAGTISPIPAGGMPRAEPIGAPKEEPKKLPSGDGKDKGENKKPGTVRLIPQPVDAPELDIAPATGKSPF